MFVIVVFSISSCKESDSDEDYSNSSALAFNLVKTCVDRILTVYSEFNTSNYVLDLTDISTLNREGVDSFLKKENPILPLSIYDTTTVSEKEENQNRTRVLDNIIVKFKEIDFIDKKHVSVTLTKTRTANQVIRITLDLKRDGDSYKIVRQETRR